MQAQRHAGRLLANPERLAECRRRLASLSWFMRCLNEPIARRANREDECTGRFWEGGFKCQVLLDERGVLAAMAYVDLNPIRAGITQRLDRSRHTSVARRVEALRREPERNRAKLGPVCGATRARLSLGQADYIALVDWIGRQVRPDKKGAIGPDQPSALRRLGVDAAGWTFRYAAWARGTGVPWVVLAPCSNEPRRCASDGSRDSGLRDGSRPG